MNRPAAAAALTALIVGPALGLLLLGGEPAAPPPAPVTNVASASPASATLTPRPSPTPDPAPARAFEPAAAPLPTVATVATPTPDDTPPAAPTSAPAPTPVTPARPVAETPTLAAALKNPPDRQQRLLGHLLRRHDAERQVKRVRRAAGIGADEAAARALEDVYGAAELELD